jgi:hypothetical protein
LEDWRLLVALAHTSHGYVVVNGKYQVVKMNGGFAVRNITTGYVEAICMSKTKARTIANQLNRGT